MSQVSGSARIISPGPAASKETSEGPGGRPSDTGHSQFPTPDLFWKLLLLFCLTFSHSRSTGPWRFFFFSIFICFPYLFFSPLASPQFTFFFFYLLWNALVPTANLRISWKKKGSSSSKASRRRRRRKAFAPRAPSAGALVSSVGPRFHLRIVLGYLPLLCKPYYFFMRSHAKLMGSLAFPPPLDSFCSVMRARPYGGNVCTIVTTFQDFFLVARVFP